MDQGNVMETFKKLSIAILLMYVSAAHSAGPASPQVAVVKQFIAAFNKHDSSAMANFVIDEIEWLSINGEKISTETKGKDELIKTVDSYFKSCPSCRTRLTNIASTPNRVSAIEIASWQGKNGSKSQRSISVYEFSGELISRVYYFPAEK